MSKLCCGIENEIAAQRCSPLQKIKIMSAIHAMVALVVLPYSYVFVCECVNKCE